MTTKEKINLIYKELIEIVGLEVLEVKTLQFLQRLKTKSNNGHSGRSAKDYLKSDDYLYIVNYLNRLAGKTYRWKTPETKALIRARFNEGYGFPDFEKVIEIKVKQWLTDEDMMKYLRPKTLFGSKFEDYLQEWYAFKKKEEIQKAQYERAKRLEQGQPDEYLTPEEIKKQEEWRELSKKVLAQASKEDYQNFYKGLKPPFKDMAYKRGLEDNLVKNLFVQWLKDNLSTNNTNKHEEGEK